MNRLLELAENIGRSETMKNSMVAFIPGLLADYARGGLTKVRLFTDFARQNREAQFYFSHMPKEMIRDNQRIFGREFVFADRLRDLLEKYAGAEDAAFDSLLEKCMEDYLRSLPEDENPG